MSDAPVVSNSSPLIALHGVGRMELLHDVLGDILIPPAVVREVQSIAPMPSWLSEQTLKEPIGPLVLSATLGPGEAEALALALEIRPRLLLLDDRPARRLAEAYRLPVIGTLGILLAAKGRGLVPAIRPLCEELLRQGFRVSESLLARVLADAGEAM